ncbi:MAG: DUF1924 domain-containing protein [Chromatiales bacterium]|jgi:hypothetical protein
MNKSSTALIPLAAGFLLAATNLACAANSQPVAYSSAEESFSIHQGEQNWIRKMAATGDEQRACSDCHTTDPTQAGKHIRTGKLIEAMAPSVNPQRLTDGNKVEKWFRRNCKWTWGRSCTEQEKTDFINYLNSL